MKKIVFLNSTILLGGIERTLEVLLEKIKKKFQLEVVYLNDEFLDLKVVKALSKHAKVYKLSDETKIECDVIVYCNTYFDYDKISKMIKAKKSIAWVHSKPYELEGSLLLSDNFKKEIDRFVCVSETVKNEIYSIEENKKEVIHNLINTNIKELSKKYKPDYDADKLNFIVVSRLSKGKGFEKLLKFDYAFEKSEINYKVTVIGNGRSTQEMILKMFDNRNNVKFIGPMENPYPYIANADYLVQLSDYETWGNVITEAKMLGTPCVVTNFPAAVEQINDRVNGNIISLEEDDYTEYIKEIVLNRDKYSRALKKFKYIEEIDKWYKLLNN